MTELIKVPTYEKVVQVYNGDAWKQPVRISDANNYHDWRAQWRPGLTSNKAVELTIDVDGEYITISASPEQVALMQGTGVIDIQAMPGPRTFIKINTYGEEDVTK